MTKETGDYWKRYRRILAWKLSGDDVPPKLGYDNRV